MYDLNLPCDDVEPLVHRERACILLSLGYTALAATHSASNRLVDADKCNIKAMDRAAFESAGPGVRQLLQLRESSAFAPRPATSSDPSKATNPPMAQLTRLTFSASEPVHAQALSGAGEGVLRSYDIVAVQPKSERVMQMACTSLDIDLISLDLSQRLPFKLRPQALKAAVARGIYFEVCYSGCLRDAASRRQLFSNAQALTRLLRGKHIVLSSGARHAFELRSPLDLVCGIGPLLGLSQGQARDALSTNCRAVVAHGAARKMHAGAILVGRGPASSAEALAEQAAAAAAAQKGPAQGPVATSQPKATAQDLAAAASPVQQVPSATRGLTPTVGVGEPQAAQQTSGMEVDEEEGAGEGAGEQQQGKQAAGASSGAGASPARSLRSAAAAAAKGAGASLGALTPVSAAAKRRRGA